MDWSFLPQMLSAALLAATPLLIAGLGELVTEKSGVLNLGVEGMMLMGAVLGFIVALESGSFFWGVLAAAGVGGLVALFFALLTVVLRANQAACGLALTIFGTGLSAFLGLDYEGQSLPAPAVYAVPFLADLPLVGKLLFQHTLLVYFALVMLAAVFWFLRDSRWGLIVRAVGDNHQAAKQLGYPVIGIRLATTVFGGVMAGLAGAYLSLVYTPLWTQNMTAGRGWIVLALVVFASWRPLRLFVGAYLFGGIGILNFFLQNWGVNITPQFLSMAPYLTTIVVLTLIIWWQRHGNRRDIPHCLGQPLPLS